MFVTFWRCGHQRANRRNLLLDGALCVVSGHGGVDVLPAVKFGFMNRFATESVCQIVDWCLV